MQEKNTVNVVDKPSPTLPEGKEPTSQNKNRALLARKKAFAAFLLLGCIIGASFLIIQGTRSAPPVVSNVSPPTLPKPWCAAPPSLSTNFSGTSLSGLAGNDVWSAGAQIMHWDGNAWNVAFGLPSSQDVFHNIVEIAPTDVWIVGEHLTSGLPSHMFTVHWYGRGWQIINTPDVAAGGKNALVAVSAIAANDVWAAGFVVPQKGPAGPLIEHWDGTKWSAMTHLDTLGSAQFTSIKALSNNDVWAVGYKSMSSSGKTITQPVTAHWNGKQWSAVENPNLNAFGGGNLYNIGGSSANDLWAVGSVNTGMLTEHWDGKSWSMITSPSVPSNSSNWLASVAGSAPDNVWAVGRVGNTGSGFQSFIEHWDGHQWQTVQNPAQEAGELDIVTVVGQQFWIAGIPRAPGGHAFIETICP